MKRKCVDCFQIHELDENPREKAIEWVREQAWLADIARVHANEAASNALADYGFKLEDGPYYDFDRREFGLMASYVGGGVNESAKALDEVGADVSITITLEHGCCGRVHSNFEVEVYEPGSGNCESVRSEARHLAELAFNAAKEAVENEWDHTYSDNYIEELCVANEILFAKDGEPCPL